LDLFNEKNHLEDPYDRVYLYYSEEYHKGSHRFKDNRNNTINDAVFLEGFKDNRNIKVVSANYRFNVIKDEAFSGCSNLDTVYLPDSIEYVGSNAFVGCSSSLIITINSYITCQSDSFGSGTKITNNSGNISSYYTYISN